jgi:hypothetical protein
MYESKSKDEANPKATGKTSPETIEERVHRHISDINSKITDDDIRSVKTELDVRRNSANRPEKENKANKKQKKSVRPDKKANKQAMNRSKRPPGSAE